MRPDPLGDFGAACVLSDLEVVIGLAPDVILRSLEAIAVEPRDCLLVGDAPADMEAGKRAGVKTCAVRYGYGKQAELARWEPDYWVDDLRELRG